MTLELIYKINLMGSKIKILQVIPRLGYGGAETGCYDLAHYLAENGCSSYIVTSGGELIKYIDKKKVKFNSTSSTNKKSNFNIAKLFDFNNDNFIF